MYREQCGPELSHTSTNCNIKLKATVIYLLNYGDFNTYFGMLFTERYLLLYVNTDNVVDCVQSKEAVPYFVFDG